MKVTKFYRVTESWSNGDSKNFSSWDLAVKHLQKHSREDFGIIETPFEEGFDFTPLTQKAYDQICDIIVKDMANWSIEDAQRFFENVFEIKEEELETE